MPLKSTFDSRGVLLSNPLDISHKINALGVEHTAIIDTGCQVCLITPEAVEALEKLHQKTLSRACPPIDLRLINQELCEAPTREILLEF